RDADRGDLACGTCLARFRTARGEERDRTQSDRGQPGDVQDFASKHHETWTRRDPPWFPCGCYAAARSTAAACSACVTRRSATNDINGIVPASMTSSVFMTDQRDFMA